MPLRVGSVLTSVVAPALLFVLTAAFCWNVGGPLFAAVILTIVSAHAAGHFVVARSRSVACAGPYFAPYHALFGTSGAFLRFRWPIASRLSLACVFIAGPIAGITFSVIAILIGLMYSDVVLVPDSNLITFEFGDSLLAFALGRLVLGDLASEQDVLLSPIAWAGWVGLHLNMLQLLPVGRFDGGRLAAALFGFRTSEILSFVFIALMLIGSFFEGGRPYVALFAACTHLGLRKQYKGMDPDSMTRKQALAIGMCMAALLVLVIPFRTPKFEFQ